MESQISDRELKSMLLQIAAGAFMCAGLFSFVYVSMLLAKFLIGINI